MHSNRLIYGAWLAVLLGAIGLAGFRASRPQNTAPQPETAPPPATEPERAASTRSDSAVGTVGYVQDRPPARLPVVSDSDPLAGTKLKALQRIVAEEMPQATAEEISIWTEEFQDLPEDAVRFLLRQRRMTRGATAPGEADSGPPPSPLSEIPPTELASIPQSHSALQLARQITLGNLLNSQSVGYRRRMIEFTDDPGASGSGLAIAEVRLDMSPGPVTQTDRPLDLAITGDGFFVLTSDDDQKVYTRAGRFSVGRDRRLSLRVGDAEFAVCGLQTLPESLQTLTVEFDGQVTIRTADAEEASIGRIEVVTFLDASRLTPVEGCLLRPSPGSGPACPARDTNFAIRQGSLEGSNASAISEQAQLRTLAEWSEHLHDPGR